MSEIWTTVKSLLKEEIPGHSYRMWIEPITPCEDGDGDFILNCPNLFSKKRVVEHYGRLIENAVATVAGRRLNVRLVVASSQKEACRQPDLDRQLKLPDI